MPQGGATRSRWAKGRAGAFSCFGRQMCWAISVAERHRFFAQCKAMLRKAGEHSVSGLWSCVRKLADIFQPLEYAICFSSCGYDPDWPKGLRRRIRFIKRIHAVPTEKPRLETGRGRLRRSRSISCKGVRTSGTRRFLLKNITSRPLMMLRAL